MSVPHWRCVSFKNQHQWIISIYGYIWINECSSPSWPNENKLLPGFFIFHLCKTARCRVSCERFGISAELAPCPLLHHLPCFPNSQYLLLFSGLATSIQIDCISFSDWLPLLHLIKYLPLSRSTVMV